MKIAVFYPDAYFAPWSMCGGLVNTLCRAGHQVLAGKLPAGDDGLNPTAFEALKLKLPTLEQLAEVDLVIVSGPELIVPWLEAVYGKYDWKFTVKAPKAAWYHSPFFNDRVTINFEHLSYWATEHFFPAWQDADHFDQEGLAKGQAHWLPFGVDADVFNYSGNLPRFQLAHVGSLGDKAFRYMEALSAFEHPTVVIGQVKTETLDGFNESATAYNLAIDLRTVKIFFNFPGPQFLEAKLLEAMACGSLVMTPVLTGSRGISTNHSGFKNYEHWILYVSKNVPHTAKLLREWSSEEKAAEREKIALAGSVEVALNHSLEKRLEEMFCKIGIKELVQ